MLKWFPAFSVLLLLAACQQAPVMNEDSQWMRITPGSSIILNQAVAVPKGDARVFLQAGKAVDKARLNQYHPHCNFEVRSVSDGNMKIEPDTFLVTDVVTGEEEVVTGPSLMRPMVQRVSFESAEGSNMISLYVRHRLHSERQPQVMRLTCHGGFGDPSEVHYPSVSDIRNALGDIATVKLVGY